MNPIETFLRDSHHFAYTKRGLYYRSDTWSKWKEERYTNEQMIELAKRYTNNKIAWYRSTTAETHTLFVLDFDVEIPKIEGKVKSLIQSSTFESGKEKWKMIKRIEAYRLDKFEQVMLEFLDYAFSIMPELKDEFFWKFSGGTGRRHAIQKTSEPINPLGFYPVFKHFEKKLGLYELNRDLIYEGETIIDGEKCQYKVKIDLAMTDPQRLLRGVYSPHFKDTYLRYSVPIPSNQLLNPDYIKNHCYRLPDTFQPISIPDFKYMSLYDENINKDIKEANKKTIKVSPTETVTINMEKIPDRVPKDAFIILETLTDDIPCLNIKDKKSHPARTRFGNISTQKYSPEVVTAYFRDHVNDKEHNQNLHVAYYHLKRLKPYGAKKFGYWGCKTFQNPKNNFRVEEEVCKKCPVYNKHQPNGEEPKHRQNPYWYFTDMGEAYKEVSEQQLDREPLRAKLKEDMHKILDNNVQFNEVRAPVRTGKTKGIIDALSERSRGLILSEKSYFVGNISGTKENVHSEALQSEYEGRVIEWVAKNNLCPIKRENPNFIITAGFCNTCRRKEVTDELYDSEVTQELFLERWDLGESPSKDNWLNAKEIVNDGACTYYAMRYYVKYALEAEGNVLLIGDPRFVMNRDMIITQETETWDWINKFNHIIYDEGHTLMNVAYESMVKGVDVFTKNENVDELVKIVDAYNELAEDNVGVKALRNLQMAIRGYSTSLKIHETREITEVNHAEDEEKINHSTITLQKLISRNSLEGFNERQKEAVSKLLEMIGIHQWIIINHNGDNWFDLFIYGNSDRIYHTQTDVLASSHVLFLKARQIVQEEHFENDNLNFPVLPIHLAKKVIFMSATPNTTANEILMIPNRVYEYFPKNQARIIFNYGYRLYKKSINRLQSQISMIVNEIALKQKGRTLLVSDTKDRLGYIENKKITPVKSYHPRDAQNAEGTTLKGYDVALATSVSIQNIVSTDNMSRIIAEVWDYDKEGIENMFLEMAVSRVIQAVSRVMPYNDDSEPVTFILLDERFLQFKDQVVKAMSPAHEPFTAITQEADIPFQKLIDYLFIGKQKARIMKSLKTYKINQARKSKFTL